VADDEPVERIPRPLDVLLVAAAVVGVVALAAVVTLLLPDDIEGVVYRTPLAIVVLVAGTGLVLWRISRRERS
jgi:hypothetical protein